MTRMSGNRADSEANWHRNLRPTGRSINRAHKQIRGFGCVDGEAYGTVPYSLSWSTKSRGLSIPLHKHVCILVCES